MVQSWMPHGWLPSAKRPSMPRRLALSSQLIQWKKPGHCRRLNASHQAPLLWPPAGRQRLTWWLSSVLGRGCGMTSLASSDVVMILASVHIKMPWAPMDKCRSDPRCAIKFDPEQKHSVHKGRRENRHHDRWILQSRQCKAKCSNNGTPATALKWSAGRVVESGKKVMCRAHSPLQTWL